jgi:hypothetical protein
MRFYIKKTSQFMIKLVKDVKMTNDFYSRDLPTPVFSIKSQAKHKLGMVAHACNSSSWESQAGGLL